MASQLHFCIFELWFNSVQSLSLVRLFATPWTAAHQASLSITNSQSLLKFMSIDSVMPANHLILCCPRLLPTSIFPSIRVFSYESSLHIRWPKYWSFIFSISPSNEHPGLISFRMVYSPHFTFLPLTLSCMWGLWPSYVCGILLSIKLNLIFSCYFCLMSF